MNDKLYRILEFDKIRAMLAERAASETGAQLCACLIPKAGATDSLNRTAAAYDFIRQSGKSPVYSFPDMTYSLKRVHAALYLSAGELLGVASFLKSARIAKEALIDKECARPLYFLADELPSYKIIEQDIMGAIISEEEIADNASAALFDIRKKLRSVNEKAREKLNNFIKSAEYSKYLQEPIITVRHGRLVIPVKQEARKNIPGIVHDQSGSGATIFVEPSSIVELGNEEKRLIGLEREEIQRILSALTAKLEPLANELICGTTALAELDMIFAKAALAIEQRATCPKMGEYINIKAGRHPLIKDSVVVPIDINLGHDISTLIITGPNTGGKTVTLKTVGLFSLMAQAGMFLPADEGTVMREYDRVFADIGDEQSIEQSLSTFSSHMKNIVSILSEADDSSLVLLDELGAGTDPVEGAALAMSILLELHSRNASTLATTHYSEIKAFAISNEGMQNASMEFDTNKLCPTYKLFIGIPGKSNAFEIASRLGLDESIILSARKYLTKEEVEFEDVIKSAQEQRQSAAIEHERAKALRYELEALYAATQKEKEKLQKDKQAIKQKAREEAQRIVRAAREQMDQAITQLRLTKGDMKTKEKAIAEARKTVNELEGSLIDPIGVADREGEAPKSLKVGDRVKALSLGQNATVIKPQNAKGEVLIQAGIIKLNLPIDDLRLIEPELEQKGYAGVSLTTEFSALALDLRGSMVDEAIILVDRYIDEAIIKGRHELQIIHGKGTGALRSGIQKHLRTHKAVKSFRAGAYGEGDAGVTVITLK